MMDTETHFVAKEIVMSTQTAFLLVGGIQRFSPGIDPDVLLSLNENARLAWTARSLAPDLYEAPQVPAGALVPETPDSAYLLTDAIFRFCPEISTHAGQLAVLRRRLEIAAPRCLGPDGWDLAALPRNGGPERAILDQARELIETGVIHAKLVLTILDQASDELLLANLERLHVRHEVCRSTGETQRGARALPLRRSA